MDQNLYEVLDPKTRERVFAKALAVALIYVKELGGTPAAFKEWVKDRADGAAEDLCFFTAVELGQHLMAELKAEQDMEKAISEARGQKSH